jgi:hypothetical protein
VQPLQAFEGKRAGVGGAEKAAIVTHELGAGLRLRSDQCLLGGLPAGKALRFLKTWMA